MKFGKVHRSLVHALYVINETPGYEDSANKPVEAHSMHHKLPASMPTPAPLLYAAPPQPKNEIETPAPPREVQIIVPQTESPLLEASSNLFTTAEGEKTEMPSDVNSKPAFATKPLLPDESGYPVLAEGSNLVTEGTSLFSWKSMQLHPPHSPSNGDEETKSTVPTTDAKETIGEGTSLKEQMADFQDTRGPGPADPPPKPTTKKPMWKPPPKLVSSPSLGEEKLPVELKAAIRSPLSDPEPTQMPTKKPTESVGQGGEGSGVKKEPDEEEHQRGDDTAVRVKTLNGTKTGKPPPVVAPKPFIRRPDAPKEDQTRPGANCIRSLDEASLTVYHTEVTSLPPAAVDLPKERGEPRPEGMLQNYPYIRRN